MKTLFTCIFSAAFAVPLSIVLAQDPAAVPLPGQNPPGEKSALDHPVSLMPEAPGTIQKSARDVPTVPAIPDSSFVSPPAFGSGAGAAAAQKSKTIATEEDLKLRIRFREVKTQALKDPALHEQWDRAHATRTDREKRAQLREYYTQLYARMLKIDNSLAPRIEEQKKLSFARLDQSRVTTPATANTGEQVVPGEDQD